MSRFNYYTRRCCYGLSFPFAIRIEPYDELEPPKRFIPTTGIERVQALFAHDERGYISKEVITATTLTAASLTIGALYGAIIAGKPAMETFLLANEQTRYVSPYEAKRKLNDFVAFKSFQKGLWYGCKFASVTALYAFSNVCIVAYRGQDGILEYVISGTFAGACARFHLGWKATLGAGFLGGLLGTIIGTILFVSGKITGTTSTDFRKWMYDLAVERDLRKLEVEKENVFRSQEYGTLLRAHMLRLKSDLGYKISDEDRAFVVSQLDARDEEAEEDLPSSLAKNPKHLDDAADSAGENISNKNVASSKNSEDEVKNTGIPSSP